MPDDRQKQIETLARKIMGLNDDFCAGTRFFVGGHWCNWNPFTNPADCEMLKAKLDEKHSMFMSRNLAGATCELRFILSGDCHECSQQAETEYEAVCLAALKLPECVDA